MALIIGLIYSRNENWIAGSYYIQNLIHALAIQPGDLPHLKIYTESQSEYEELIRITNYPFIKRVPMTDQNSFIDRVINKISYKLFKRHLITKGIDVDADVFFPASNYYLFDNIKGKLIWIPDFQERHYPNLFPTLDIEKRKAFHLWVIRNHYPIVFSSKAAANDFKLFYPHTKNKIYIMPFAVTLPSLESIQIGELRNKYELNGDYFICSNQFWAHKNHIVVLQAFLSVCQLNSQVKLIFTGKPFDDRNPTYFASLVNFVEENKLSTKVMFLGFIDRAEQLVLMKNSLAVIQPSLFEGWSTVVEDAKALNIPIIISDIPVHREQLEDLTFFFEKDNAQQLAKKMMTIIGKHFSVNKIEYYKNIEIFGKTFLGIVNQSVQK